LDYESLISKKGAVADFLGELESYWILNYPQILAFELLHINENIKEKAHEFYSIYSSCPFDIMQNQKPYAVKSSASYPCDKIMPFRYSPYSDCSEELRNPGSTWREYFEHTLKDINYVDSIEKILEEYLSFDEMAFKRKEELEKYKEIIHKKRIKLLIIPLIGCHYLDSHQQYIEEKTNQIYDRMSAALFHPTLLHYAPLYSIYDPFYWHTLKHWDVRKKEEKKLRDILDRLHAHIALSYCDYFLTNDGPIKKNCVSIIKELGIQSSFLGYEKNPFAFIYNN